MLLIQCENFTKLIGNKEKFKREKIIDNSLKVIKPSSEHIQYLPTYPNIILCASISSEECTLSSWESNVDLM